MFYSPLQNWEIKRNSYVRRSRGAESGTRELAPGAAALGARLPRRAPLKGNLPSLEVCKKKKQRGTFFLRGSFVGRGGELLFGGAFCFGGAVWQELTSLRLRG